MTPNDSSSSELGPSRANSAMLRTTALVVGSVLGLGLACGGSDPEPETPASLAPTATTAPTQTQAPAATTAAPADTTPQPSPLAPVEPALAQLAQGVLDQVAKEEAPAGATASGLPKVALLGTGQSSEMTLSMAPGKCYTLIAVGLPPIAELHLQLLPATTIPGMTAALGEDQMVGPRAVVGKAPNCFKWPLPVAGAARVVTTVAAGQGLVATQIYEK